LSIIKCASCNSQNTSFFLRNFKQKEFWKCNECKLIFNYPPVIPEYEKDSWTNAIDPDGNKRDLTKDREFKLKNWYGDITKFLEKIPHGSILDYGCGLGYLLSSIPNSWKKYGYDVSNFSQNYIQKNFQEINIIDKLEIENQQPKDVYQEKFDVVICYHVIEHIVNPKIFLENLSLLIKPNGYLIIGTPNLDSIAAKIFKGNFRLLGDDGHVSLFTNKSLRKFVEQNNFFIVKEEYPFFKTEYFNIKNIIRMFNPTKISPPCYKNIMTFYAKKYKK